MNALVLIWFYRYYYIAGNLPLLSCSVQQLVKIENIVSNFISLIDQNLLLLTDYSFKIKIIGMCYSCKTR
jgi:hypothetical protein